MAIKASSKSVVAKLGLKAGQRVLVLRPPRGYLDEMGALPPGVEVATTASGEFDVIQVFVSSMDELERQLIAVANHVKPLTALWITYPKGTAGVRTDVNRDRIRTFAATRGWQAVSLFAVDDTWSALRLKKLQRRT
jgi:hypothetical protein